MHIMFVVSDIVLSEPIGVLQLSAECKKIGWSTGLVALRRSDLIDKLFDQQPDVVAFSAMTPDIRLFEQANAQVRGFAQTQDRPILRIMGGPHPTYFPKIVDEYELDAICIGEGDRALPTLLCRRAEGQSLAGIPNIQLPGEDHFEPEIVTDLDALAFADRQLLYGAAPYYQHWGMKSVLTSRGCPYHCTYCHNHQYNQQFSGCGPILRRRSVESVIDEIKLLIEQYPPVRMLRFADDTFAHKIDDWLTAFLDRYRQEIGLPFYCLMRSNTLTDPMAKLLADAGCISIGMAVETGSEEIRNRLLKRNLTNQMVIDSFNAARAHGIRTYGNTMFALPGTTIEDDFKSFEFTRDLKLDSPTFGIFCPYPKTELTRYALDHDLLDEDVDLQSTYGQASVLKGYSDQEKACQLRLVRLAPLFCSMPKCFTPLLKLLLRMPLGKLYGLIGALWLIWKTTIYIFPYSWPRHPFAFYMIVKDSLGFISPAGNRVNTQSARSQEGRSSEISL